MTGASLAPWTRYIDALPEPHRSLFIHEFKQLLSRMLDVAPMFDRHDRTLDQRRRLRTR